MRVLLTSLRFMVPILLSSQRRRKHLCRLLVPKGNLLYLFVLLVHSSVLHIRYLEVMEVLLPFASEGVQGIPGGVELLQRAAAGGFVALTDKMATLNGTLLSLQYLNTFFNNNRRWKS